MTVVFLVVGCLLTQHFDFQIRYSSDDSASLQYCEQVTLAEYENQRMSSSQQALVTLLEEIIADKDMAAKNKRKRLKQVKYYWESEHDVGTCCIGQQQAQAILGICDLPEALQLAYSCIDDGADRPLVKNAFQKNNFLISQPKYMLWVLKRTVSMRGFF